MTASPSVAAQLLLALPVVVLIVPQGTVERSLVPELAFAGFMLLVLTAVLAQSSWTRPAFAIRRTHVHPLLLVCLVFMLALNPLWSLWMGNAPARILMSALPFIMLGAYWLFALIEPDPAFIHRLTANCGWAGVLLGAAIIANFLAGDLSWSAMRSTGIEGERTLSLPALPMGGVIAFGFSLGSPTARARRTWGAVTLVCTVAILLTVTRAMLLTFLVGCLISLALIWLGADFASRQRIRRALLLALVILPVIAAPMIGNWLERLDPTNQNDVGTILGRFDEYAAFIGGFLSSPVLGQGMGHSFTYPSDFDWTLRDQGITVCHSHLFFMLGTGGMLGAAAYYVTLAHAFWLLLRKSTSRDITDPMARSTLASVTGAFACGITFTLTSTTFTALSYNITLAAFMLAATSRWDAGMRVPAPEETP